MEMLTIHNVFASLCLAEHKFGMYISFSTDYKVKDPFGEIIKAAPYLNINDNFQILSDEMGILLFDTRKEMQRYYDMTVGDDGPTKLNKYSGSAHVYALTCNNRGELENENT